MSDLDTTFNTPQGYVVTDFFIPPSDASVCRAIALQTDGNIVMAGESHNPATLDVLVALCRYKPDGTLDNTFGINGKVTELIPSLLSSSPSLNTYSLAIQQDGKIVVCGERQNSAGFQEMFVTRFTPSGALDTAFASPNGYIFITPAMFTAAYPGTTFDNAYATSVKIDTTTTPNKIIVGGHVRKVVASGLSFLSLVKLDLSGALDNTFGINGLLAKNFSGLDEYGLCLAVTSSGDYLLGGYQNSLLASSSFMTVAKFDSSGSPDNSFGSSGISVISNFAPSSSSYDSAASIAIQQDGKIVLGGTAYFNSISCYIVARLLANGNLDTANFGTGGKVITNIYFQPSSLNYNLTGNSIGIQSDGKIILGGYYEDMTPNPTTYSFSLARYETNGSLDLSFGINGTGLILEDLPVVQEKGYSLAIQTDGKILLGGEVGDFSDDPNKRSFILARYLPSQEPSPPTPPPEPTTVCINTCNDRNNKCTYSDYSTFLNSKTTCRPVNQKTYKSYSSGGFKGSKGSPNSYLNSISSKFCANYADTTETSPYLRYSDLSNCCKFVCKSFTSTIPSSSCSPFSPNFTINYNALLQSNDNCPLNNSIDTYFSPVISQGTPPGGVFTISQPGISGINTLFTIDSSTGVVMIPVNTSSGPIAGEYTITYTVCGYFIQWTAFVTDC